MGIENLKKLVVFFAMLGSAADKATRNGLGLEDIGDFIGPLMKAPEAIEGIDKVKLEAQDLDTAEMDELKAAVAANLDLVDDELEGVVIDAIGAIVSVYGIYEKIQKIKAKA
jgi:hypothetical protein